MFDFESQLEALANFGLRFLLDDNEIQDTVVLKFLVEEGLIDISDYVNLDEEHKAWKELEE